MSQFAQIDERKPRESNSTFRKTEYMNTGQGEHVIRILEAPAKKFYVHFLGFSYVQCLGDDCPVCDNNQKLLYEFKKDANKQKTWKPRSERFYVNVMDKTRAKVCASCGTEEMSLERPTCSKCNEILPDASPLNKVKVLAKGKTVFDDFNLLSQTVRNEQDEVVDILNYDWTLIFKGEGKDTTSAISPRYNPAKEFPQDLGGQELFDLSSVVPSLTREEMIDALNGVSIKDIFAVRRATKEAAKVNAPAGDPVLMNDIRASVDEIFKS